MPCVEIGLGSWRRYRYPRMRSIAVGINDGELTLGRFQSIIFAEFDGPRKREISIQVLAE